MIDYRYHIYSLAAVFLALAVGIVIGTSFARSSPPAEMLRGTVRRYEGDMRNLRNEIRKASEEADKAEAFAKTCQDFCKTVLPIVVKGKLAGRNVAIIRTGDYDELEGGVRQALEAAGAQVTGVTIMSRSFPFDDNEKIAEALLECGITPGEEGVEARDKLFSVIAETICTAKHSDVLPRLEEAGIAQFSGDYYRYNALVVLVGGARTSAANAAETMDARLIAQFAKQGATVVGCEGSNAASSYVLEWHKTGVASVDNSETAMGQLALVYALNGEIANFGCKESADRLIPQTLEIK